MSRKTPFQSSNKVLGWALILLMLLTQVVIFSHYSEHLLEESFTSVKSPVHSNEHRGSGMRHTYTCPICFVGKVFSAAFVAFLPLLLTAIFAVLKISRGQRIVFPVTRMRLFYPQGPPA